ncbi:hypothetical protein INT44_007048 [Umbelopsis vinacea]|uniref:Uncharacterized protein n=1 Tax=Umbelopsis vinacea TaxID=44442 RepID=A0A8H7U8C9_9FUNG|nr:hypothetical protein INT44_007048 [Umbelopsis vinacea]
MDETHSLLLHYDRMSRYLLQTSATITYHMTSCALLPFVRLELADVTFRLIGSAYVTIAELERLNFFSGSDRL